MATATLTLYDNAPKAISGGVDLDADTLKVALLNNSHAHNNAHTVFGDVSANEISGTNYVAGGQALANRSWSRSAGVAKLDADDLTWSGLIVTGLRYGVLYRHDEATPANRLLLATITLDSGAFNVDGDYKILWHADGILTVSKA